MTQERAILAHLRAGRSITPLEALRRFGCLRLGARVYDLRRRGHKIINVWQTAGDKRFARYRMV